MKKASNSTYDWTLVRNKVTQRRELWDNDRTGRIMWLPSKYHIRRRGYGVKLPFPDKVYNHPVVIVQHRKADRIVRVCTVGCPDCDRFLSQSANTVVAYIA